MKKIIQIAIDTESEYIYGLSSDGILYFYDNLEDNVEDTRWVELTRSCDTE